VHAKEGLVIILTTLPSRFKFLDFMKGIALVFILWAHLGMWWQDGSWTSAHAFGVVFIFRPFGPSNFIFASIFGLLLSVETREKGGPGKAIPSRLLKRSVVFIGIGCILNLIGIAKDIFNPDVLFALSLLRVLLNCNIFTFLGIAQLVIYYGRKLHPAIQVILIAGIVSTYYLLAGAFTAECNLLRVEYRYGDLFLSDIASPVAILYFLLMFENSMAPLFPYIALVFIVNLVYRNLIKMLAVPRDSAQIEKAKAEMRRIAWISLLLSCTGVILGIMTSPGLINQMEYLNLVHADAFRVWNPAIGGYPLFLQSGNPGYILYSFGIVSLLVLGGTWLVDLSPRKRRLVDIIATFGSYSLTVFITHAIASFFPLEANFLAFSALYGLVTLLYVAAIYYWNKAARGKFSLEWLLGQFLAGSVIQRIKQRKAGNHGERGETKP
jgi:hypothetical protein